MFKSKLPKRINIERLCQHGDRLQGEILAKEMPRLLEISEAIASPAKVLLDFKRDEIGQAVVLGFIEVKIELICQRCMKVYIYEINNKVNWAVVKNDTQAKQLQQQYEPILEAGGSELDLLTQLEDELILNIPIIPMHENLSECVSLESKQDSNELIEVKQIKNNPFASLADLKKK